MNRCRAGGIDTIRTMKPVYASLYWSFRGFCRFAGHQTTRVGANRLPRTGGAILAINHTSYLDFIFGAAEIQRAEGRQVRFLGKSELADNRFVKFLMKHCGVISVNRHAGRDAYVEAVKALREGSVVGVYPEATIGRSFELKSFKSGAARMSLEANVPIYPTIVWGAQRVVTKGYHAYGRTKTPIAVAVGEPIMPAGTAHELTAVVKEAMRKLLYEVQDAYGDHPAGEFWVPQRLGGGAISLAEAEEIDRQVAAERKARNKPQG